jgi:hypothetical protein
MLKRFSAEASPFSDKEAYAEALHDLRRVAARATPSTMAERALANRFEAFEKQGKRQIFANYDKMSDEQVRVAGERARALQLQLMKDYYRMRGVVKE